MAHESFMDSPVWEEFKKAARKRRRDPARLLTEYMRECLEIWEDEKLFKEIQRDARRSGFKEEDAVEIVRQHRLEKQPAILKGQFSRQKTADKPILPNAKLCALWRSSRRDV